MSKSVSLLSFLLLVHVAVHLSVDGAALESEQPQWLAPSEFEYVSKVYSPRSSLMDFNYHHYDELTTFLRNIHEAYPQLTSMYSIGQSVQGRELWVLMITSNPQQRPLLKPAVKYVGNIHGNEPVGREMLLHLIEYLVLNYEQDTYIRSLVDSTEIHVLPSMNPDGFEKARVGDCRGVHGRYNSNGQDLNRNFPEFFKGGKGSQLQPEASAISRWMKQRQFILSASLHGGALVASYPFDNKDDDGVLTSVRGYQPSLTPDDDTFHHLATTYSFAHRKMSYAEPCHRGDYKFPNGTTNGADWYYLAGGMQDFNYIWNACMELTLELSCCKYPPAEELPELWEDNREALIKYLAEAHRGVAGIVKDVNGRPMADAFVQIVGRNFGARTTPLGEFWRILMPGFYTIQVNADGHSQYRQDFQVIDGKKTNLDVVLQPSQNPVRFHDGIPNADSSLPSKRPSIFSSLLSAFG